MEFTSFLVKWGFKRVFEGGVEKVKNPGGVKGGAEKKLGGYATMNNSIIPPIPIHLQVCEDQDGNSSGACIGPSQIQHVFVLPKGSRVWTLLIGSLCIKHQCKEDDSSIQSILPLTTNSSTECPELQNSISLHHHDEAPRPCRPYHCSDVS